MSPNEESGLAGSAGANKVLSGGLGNDDGAAARSMPSTLGGPRRQQLGIVIETRWAVQAS
jgi:hypothetical protein